MFTSFRSGYLAIFGVAAALLGAALLIGERPLWYYLDVTSALAGVAIMLLPPLLWLSWIGFLVTKRRFDRPTVAIYRLVKLRRAWLIRGALFTALMLPLAKSFSTIKRSIPEFVPFYADPAFAYADRLLFFGTDPWRLTHAVFGPFSTLLIDRAYLMWFPVLFGLNAWYNFTRDQKLQVRGLLSYILTWVLLGNIAAMGMASVGPCFYEIFFADDQFRPLMAKLQGIHEIYGLRAVATMNWLYENRHQERFGAGISAMPSLHVAIAFLVFLTTKHAVRSRWLRVIAGCYAMLIWIASVHLGWHYAVDGLFSIVGVAAIWWATGRYVASLDQRQAPVPVIAGPAAGGAVPASA